MATPTRTIVPFHHIEWRFSSERGGSHPPHYYCEYDFSGFGRITEGVIIRDKRFGAVEDRVIHLVDQLRLITGVLHVSVTPYSIELEINLEEICWGRFINRCHQAITRFLADQKLGAAEYKTTYLPEEKPCVD